jgi:hypothetical protein
MNEFNNSVIKMTYSSENKIIYGFWKKNPMETEIEEVMEYTVAIAREHHTGRLFLNPANIEAIDEEKWITDIFVNKIISAAGYAKIANVVPLDIFTKIPRQEILTTAPRMSFWYFDNDRSAIEWLKEENNQVKDLIKMYPCDMI